MFIIAAIFGLGIGSFLNVVILRTRAKRSLTGRSQCPACHITLRWYQLIPVLSFLIQHGRCAYCHQPISLQYPLVELATAFIFALLSIWFYSEPIRLIWYLLYAIFLILIFVYDAKYYLIPDLFSLSGIVVGVLGSVVLGASWQSLLLAIAFGAGIFIVQYLMSRGRWIGGGDIRLGAMMGAMVGWPNIIAALFVAYVLGAVVALALMLTGRKAMQDQLPFGTFLTLATLLTFFIGDDIVHWYLYEILRF